MDGPKDYCSTSMLCGDSGEMWEAASRIADELAVQRLMTRYCQLLDDGRFDEVAALFADGGVFENRGLRIGQQQLVSFLEEVQVPERRGRHSCGYASVDFQGKTTRARCYRFRLSRARRRGVLREVRRPIPRHVAAGHRVAGSSSNGAWTTSILSCRDARASRQRDRR